MSQRNVEIARRSLLEFAATQQPSGYAAPDFVWDLRHFRDWPGAEEFRGPEEFMRRIYSFNDKGQIQRLTSCSTPAEALEAAGLSQ